MDEEVEVPDPVVGYTWGESGEDRYIRNPDGDYRRVSEDATKLLEKLASGEVSKADLEGTPRKLVETLESEGYLRPGSPVVRLTPPDEIALWPRTILFAVFFGVGLVAAWDQIPDLRPFTKLFDLALLAKFSVLSLFAIALHEGGHYFAARPFVKPSIRIGRVNGVVPSAITDTTDAWILPQNRRRWITLAGPFVELVWLQAVIAVHYLVFPDSVLLSLYVVSLVSHGLFSLNPLIHGDGYWLLMDTLGKVNFRTKGIEDVRNRNPSPAAVYVVVSYGYGVFLFCTTLVSWTVLFGHLAFGWPFPPTPSHLQELVDPLLSTLDSFVPI